MCHCGLDPQSTKNEEILKQVQNDENNKILERKALCAHGCGKGNRMSTGDKPLFGNVEGSFLTSLGKVKLRK